jgi:hypothetical protein
MRDAQKVEINGTPLGRPRHVCGIFNGPEDEYAVLMPFLRDGLERGQKTFISLDPGRTAAQTKTLEKGGVDVDGRRQSGQLEMMDWRHTHLAGGRFQIDSMLRMVEGVLESAEEDGYPLTRLVANMEWALEDVPGVHQVLEYESRFNDVIALRDDAVICTYDATRWGGDAMIDILRTHPMVIVGGTLQQNPFYAPPEQFLSELRARPDGGRG